MTVSAHLTTFRNKKIEDYDPQTGITDPANTVYRISIEYDEFDNGDKIEDKIDAFANDPRIGEVTEFITGAYDFESSSTTEGIVNKLVALKDKLTNLKALFIGDITYEECEISWIQQSDISPILKAYPNLEYLQVRGGSGLLFSSLQHQNLSTLIIESGGLPPNVVNELLQAKLPNLERLDLWLGDGNYGFESTVEDFAPILSGKTFPELRHLGLMNSEIQDEFAIAVTSSPILAQLKVLDLSMGNLSDKGGEAIFNSPDIRKLDFLNLRHHYLSDEMMAKLKTLLIRINLDDQEEADNEEDRYVEVSE